MLEKVQTNRKRVALVNVRVLDVERGTLSDAANVVTEGGKIREVDTQNISACQVIDFNGLTLSPGLIDCHVHILSPYLTEQKGFPGLWSLKQMDRNCAATLASGVVCVCDMLAPIKVMNHQRGKVASGKIPGPEIVASGGIFSCPGGYPEAIHPLPPVAAAITGQPKYEPQTPAQAQNLVKYLHNFGAGVIKVGFTRLSRQLVDGRTLPAISDDVLRAVCNAAHSLGLKVRVHHNWSEDMHHLKQFEIDALEHGVYDRDLLDDEIEEFRQTGIAVVPTLTINDSQSRFEEKIGFLKSARARELFEPQALQHLTWVCETWTSFSGESYEGSFGYTRANRYCYAAEERNTENLHRAGVKMYAGTDAGAVVGWPGELPDELLRLQSIGMTAHEAIRAATCDAAPFIGRPDLGSIAPGKTASFTVIDGNPLEDLSAYRRVRYAAVKGAWYKTTHPELPDFWPGHDVIFKLD